MAPWGEIKHAKFVSADRLRVTGTLDIDNIDPDDIQGTVPIRFLLMQEKSVDHNVDQGSVIVNGDATWDPADAHMPDGKTWTTSDCSGPIAQLRRSLDTNKDGMCRGIAQATIVRNHAGRDPSQGPATGQPGNPPPFFETLTWCVNMEVLDENATKDQSASAGG